MNEEVIDQAREEIQKVIREIIEKKEQKTHGLRPASFIVTCSRCNAKVIMAFTVFDVKKKKFVCFDCFAAEI